MRCPFCGRTSSAPQAERACKTCALFGGCKKVKCPHCGYESPAEPRSLKWLRKMIGKTHD